MTTLTAEQLKKRISALPRTKLAFLPTPLEPCPNLSKVLGGPTILVKRDDMTGLALGGNKTRQLEFVFGAVLASGADTVVAGAYTQSNWCRQITAAARKHGLDVVLILARGIKGPLLQGNLLLDRLMGADVTMLDVLDEELQPYLEERTEALKRAGRKPHLISSFEVGTQSLAALGYVEAVLEICEQLGRAPDYLYIAGSEMSPAGLNVGIKALGLHTEVVSISPIVYPESRQDEISRIANATAKHLDLPFRFSPADIRVDDSYIGQAYGIISEKGLEALKLLAGLEGIILDPVYSSKGMSGLIDHIRRGLVGSGKTAVFLHTGGTPALFAYSDNLELAPIS